MDYIFHNYPAVHDSFFNNKPNKNCAYFSIFRNIAFPTSNSIKKAYKIPSLIVLLRLSTLVILFSQGRRFKRNG